MTIKVIDQFLLIAASLQTLSFCVLVYVLHAKLDSIEGYFKKNKIVTDTKNNWKNVGLLGKIPRIGMVFISLFFASYWSKRGLLELEEVLLFPLHLKLWVYVPIITGVSCLIFLMLPLGILE